MEVATTDAIDLEPEAIEPEIIEPELIEDGAPTAILDVSNATKMIPAVTGARPASVVPPAAKLTPIPIPQKLLTASMKPARLPHEDQVETQQIQPKDFSKALAQLQRQRESGAPAPPPPPSSSSPVGFETALAQLQRQRENGAPAPPPPSSSRALSSAPLSISMAGQGPPETVRLAEPPSVKDLGKEVVRPMMASVPGGTAGMGSMPPSGMTEPMGTPALVVPSTKSITSPMGTPIVGGGQLGLKPGSGGPLAPTRSPSPMAVVGGGSLRINSPDKPISVQSSAPAPVGSFAPNVNPLLPPSTARVGGGGANAMAMGGGAMSPMNGGGTGSGSIPPSASSRPATSPKSFPPPAGGPPASYERAFRQWSSANLPPPADDSSPGNLAAGPVTFQVYTASDLESGRRPMRSIVAQAEVAKPNVAMRVGLAVVGAIIFTLTAAAIIAVSGDDPKRPTPATSAAPPVTALPTDPAPAPAPTVISIGDPNDEAPATSAAATTSPATKPKPKPKAPPSPPANGGDPPASSLKGIAPPPNPYGK